MIHSLCKTRTDLVVANLPSASWLVLRSGGRTVTGTSRAAKKGEHSASELQTLRWYCHTGQRGIPETTSTNAGGKYSSQVVLRPLGSLVLLARWTSGMSKRPPVTKTVALMAPTLSPNTFATVTEHYLSFFGGRLELY